MGRHLKIYCLNDLRSFSNLWSKEAPLPVAGGDSIPQDLNLPQVPNLREVQLRAKPRHVISERSEAIPNFVSTYSAVKIAVLRTRSGHTSLRSSQQH